MLKKEDIQKLAALAKVKVEDLEAAIKDPEEKTIDVADGLHVFTETEITTLKTNEYNRAKVAAVEIAVKDAKEKMGLDFTGKTIEGLIDAASKKAVADAKIDPDKKVQELQEKLTTVQNSYKDLEAKLSEKETEISSVKINSEVFKHIPSFGENAPALAQDEVLQLMKANGYDFKNENGQVVAYKAGKQVQDKLSNPVDIKEVVTGFLKEKKLLTKEETPGGRGGGNGTPPAKFSSMTELKKHFEANGKSLLGSEFSEAVSKAVKDNPEFSMEK